MDPAPPPLTPRDSDLAGLPYMPTDLSFFDSEAEVHLTDREFRTLMYLRAAAWRARPAASLPDDDATLARHARLDLRQWRRLRKAGHVLCEFVTCSDGRLYHTALSGRACALWESRIRERDRKRRDRSGATVQRPPGDHEATGAVPDLPDKPVNPSTSEEFVRPYKVKEKEKEKEKENLSPPYAPLTTMRSRGDRGQRLPPNWQPSAAVREAAKNEAGLHSLGVDPEAAIGWFTAEARGAPGARGRSPEWDAAFMAWCWRLAERRQRRGSGPASPPPLSDDPFRARLGLPPIELPAFFVATA